MVDTFLVVDIEATCWDHKDPNRGSMEIIQIGVVHCDATANVLAKFSSYVKPETSNVSKYCSDLTGITSVMLKDADYLRDVMQKLSVWMNTFTVRPVAWYSWGDWDAEQITLECKLQRITHPLPAQHRNAKKLFQKKVLPGKRQVGFRKAAEIVGVALTGVHHNALDDAINVTKLLPFFHQFTGKHD